MELLTSTLKDPNLEMLIEDFTAHGVTVPKGFVTDGASAPRFLWSIIPPFKGTKKAAVVHDYLCRQAKNKEDRERADKLFYVMLREAGLNYMRAKMGYMGVRIGATFGVGVYYDRG